MKLSHSLRRLIGVMMAALMVLVLAMTVLGAWSIRSISRSVEQDMQTVQTGAEIANALVTSVLGEIRAAEHYLLNPSPEVKEEFVANGDSAYSYQARYRELKSLSNADRRIVNEIGANQATLEVAYATAHALLEATNGLLPYSLSTTELGVREEVEQRAADVAGLMLRGVLSR